MKTKIYPVTALGLNMPDGIPAAARVMLKSRMHHFMRQCSLEFCRRERVYKGWVVKERDSVGGHGLDRVFGHRRKPEQECPEEGMVELKSGARFPEAHFAPRHRKVRR